MIGIIPAGGRAIRINGLPKMLLPCAGETLFEILAERMMSANVRQILVAPSSATIGFLFPHFTPTMLAYGTKAVTMTEDVMLARRYIAPDEPVLFGMPDTYFEDANAFVKLAQALDDGADVAVGVFYTRPDQRRKLGMVELAGETVLNVYDKPEHTDLIWAWGVLAWKPPFWEMLNASEPHVGYALPRALAARLDVRAVKMTGGYWDCGTPEEYFQLIGHLQTVTA